MNLLSIGGSDPSSGAGIQSDVKTFDALNAYGLTVVTAITSQNTSNFGSVQPVSKRVLENQIKSIIADFPINGIKIGMVYNSEIIKTVYKSIKSLSVPIVVDPVIESTTGGILLQKSAIEDFKKYLIPLSTVITPNKFEAQKISKLKINSKNSLELAAKSILDAGAKGIVVTGLDFEKNKVIDLVFTHKIKKYFSDKKLKKINHGSGCNYSASMLFGLAQGKTIIESAILAHKFTFESIKEAYKIGKGIPITQIKKDKMVFELSNAIEQFTQIKNIAKRIPECQTNFVYSKQNPKSVNDILGISGRIVKTGNRATLAGNLEYGGSRHVASAVFVLNKNFPQIRSGINLKLEKETITKLERQNFLVKSYDRTKEPKDLKNKEGFSIQWGIKEVIKGLNNPPDAIFHNGDFGKEPMILIFANSPNQIIEKLSKVF